MPRLRTPVKKLYVSTVDEKPLDFNFGEGYGETWELVEPLNGSLTEQELEDFREQQAPMMNYFYPLTEYGSFPSDKPEQAAYHLWKKAGAVTLVRLLGDYPGRSEYGLALTGGGMDLTWDIAEGYMLMGYLPPFHYTRLPNFAGQGNSTQNKWILAGCRRSINVMEGWTEARRKDIQQIAASLRENDKAYKARKALAEATA